MNSAFQQSSPNDLERPKTVRGSSAVPGGKLADILATGQDFESWWRQKQHYYQTFLQSPIVDIEDPTALSEAEHRQISARLDAANMAVYRLPSPAPLEAAILTRLGRQFGLTNLQVNPCANDAGISEIQVWEEARQRRYIPYTNHALNWHTDGYYNPIEQPVGAFILHCNQAALTGGANRLLDQEILYGVLKSDVNIDVNALFQPDAFSIPENIENGRQIRPLTTGPVFLSHCGSLHMRYSARTRNIRWKQSDKILIAAEAIRYYLGSLPQVMTARLESGMGVISRNVLHSRDAFVDGQGINRQMLRARYTDFITPDSLSADRHALVK